MHHPSLPSNAPPVTNVPKTSTRKVTIVDIAYCVGGVVTATRSISHLTAGGLPQPARQAGGGLITAGKKELP